MGAPTELPIITVTETEQKSDTEVTVRFTNTGTRALVVLNDYVLGVTERNEVTIGGLDTSVANAVTLVPLGNEVRGEGVTVEINDGWGRGGVDFGTGVSTDAYTGAGAGVIKAPNAGGR